MKWDFKIAQSKQTDRMEAEMNKAGNVFWFTGLSGAGKTTIGNAFYKKKRDKMETVLFLDGDTLREVFGNDLGYSKENRFQCAMRYSRICKMLSEQGMDVIICTISMFDAVRDWNRSHIQLYHEIYVRVPLEVLKQRDQKGLYSGIAAGESEDVVGMDLQLELPKQPDLIFDNDGKYSPEQGADFIMEKLQHRER